MELLRLSTSDPRVFARRLARCDALILSDGPPLDADTLSGAPRLRVIAQTGTDLRGIDLEAASRQGILVMNTPEAGTFSLAELTWGLLLALARHLPFAWGALREGIWVREPFLGLQLAGKTLGLVGLGRVGSEVAQRALAFRMHVLALDPYVPEERAEELGVELAPDPEELLERADFLSLHVPLTPQTRGLLGKEAFEQMKPGTYLVNTAPLELLDLEALWEALNAGKLGGVALDLPGKEALQHPVIQRLLHHERALLVPHLGPYTQEALRRVSRQIVDQVLDALEGRDFRNALNLPFPPGLSYRALVPYMDLAEVIGRLVAQLLQGKIRRLEIDVRGKLLEEALKPLGVALLRGVLQPTYGDRVTYVNAPLLAREAGIHLVEAQQPILGHHAEAIACFAIADAETLLVVGAPFGGRPRIVQINEFPMEALPEGPVLIMRNRDVPGVIGRVGTLLGERGINIAEWRLGRDRPGGTALSFINLDTLVPEEVLQALHQVPGVEEVRQVLL